MHTTPKTRAAKGAIKDWRCQASRILARAGRDFAAKTREALYFERLQQIKSHRLDKIL